VKGVLFQLHFVMSYVPPTFVGFYLQSKDYGTDVPFILFHFWWMLTYSWFNYVGPHFFFVFLFFSFFLAFCGVLS